MWRNIFKSLVKWVRDRKLIPSSSYRTQFSSTFTFRDAEAIIPYLVELGISHVYASPILTAVKGSQHCYDVTDPFEINPELGGEAGFRRLRKKLVENGIGWIQDFVPNHMAFSSENRMLQDVLLNGQSSRFAKLFDVDWENRFFRGKIVCPILADDIENEISEIKFVPKGDDIFLEYRGSMIPVSPSAIGHVFSNPEEARKGLHNLNSSPALKMKVIRELPYDLRNWKTTKHEINYRRFFNVNGLITLNSSDIGNIHFISSKIYDLIGEGLMDGLRLDHIDGLYDPHGYLAELRKKFPKLVILVEKILSHRERLNPDWPVEGTTGYDFLFLSNSIQSSASGSSGMDSVYLSTVETARKTPEIIRESKRMIVDSVLEGDLDNIALDVYYDLRGRDYGHDITLHDLKICLSEYFMNLSAYRTYFREKRYADFDDIALRKALSASRKYLKNLKPAMDTLERYLTEYETIRMGDPRIKMQQYEPAFFAKSIEDRFFYVHNPLISRNEVGCDPYIDYLDLNEYHELMSFRFATTPHTMNLTSTHDTKFGEDLRAKINSLQDIPNEWSSKVSLWRKLNSRHLRAYDGVRCPVENQEYLIYQVLAGSEAGSFMDPDYRERLDSYLMKIIREGGRTTGWFEPNIDYEENLRSFLRDILDEKNNKKFTEDLLIFQKRITIPGAINSISQVILKILSPGFPDIYRGSETMNFSFVDPDNRRPVDHVKLYALLKSLPDRLDAGSIPGLLETFSNGELKMYVTSRLLNMRKKHSDLFEAGSYRPIFAQGRNSESMVIFSRELDDKKCIVVSRLHTAESFKEWNGELPDLWENSYVDLSGLDGQFESAITGSKKIVHGGNEYLGRITSGLPFEVLISTGD